MTEEQATLLLVKGTIADLPAETQESVKKCVASIRELLAAYPNGEAHIALALLGAELAAN
ncbi:TPA: hypothetical protein ACKP07_004974 [Serratia marcescens]|uniref:hypothetical protein n=1 Tax=Serratia marcescens TaxID=615 RepID=UPI00339C2360